MKLMDILKEMSFTPLYHVTSLFKTILILKSGFIKSGLGVSMTRNKNFWEPGSVQFVFSREKLLSTFSSKPTQYGSKKSFGREREELLGKKAKRVAGIVLTKGKTKIPLKFIEQINYRSYLERKEDVDFEKFKKLASKKRIKIRKV